MRMLLLITWLITLSSAQAAMLPMQPTFNPDGEVDAQQESSARLNLKLEDNDPLLRFFILNQETDEELTLSAGEYAMAPGQYQITLIRLDGIERKPDANYQQITDTITLTANQSITRTFPTPIRRVIATWYNDWSIAFATGTLGDDYEVSNLHKEHYDALNIANSYPETDAVGNLGGALASRTGISLGYRHLFAQSNWLAQLDLSWDQDPDQRLTRTGVHLGAGKYWTTTNTTPWISALVGQETTAWNDVTLKGNTLSGSHAVTTLNFEAGIVYRPINLHLSARVDPINQNMMASIGYIFGGKQTSHLQSARITLQ